MAMNEPDCRGVEERLPWFVSGALAPGERGAIEAHLAGCGACREALAATRRAGAIFAAHPGVELLADYALGLPVEAASRATLESHLAHCEECREELRLVASGGEADRSAASRATNSSPPRPASSSGRALALAATVAIASGLVTFVAMRARVVPPSGSVALVELSSADRSARGAGMVAEPVRASVAATLLLLTDRAESFEVVRARIRAAASDRTVREASGLLPALGGGYALLLPAGALSPGEYEIELEGRLGGEWSPLGRYRLRIEP
jgi:hypothetical protein